MVFSMQNLMRRRNSQSPSDSPSKSGSKIFGSKNKRRSLRKDSSTEGDSFSSAASSGAQDAAWRVEKIRPRPPQESEWWPEDTAVESSFECSDDSSGAEEQVETFIVKPQPGQARKFHNCGLETWLQAREKWNRRTVEVLPPRPTPAEYNQLVKGLKKHSALRSYELPRQMALSDLIDVYNDIWEGDV